MPKVIKLLPLVIRGPFMGLDFTYMVIYGMNLWVRSAKEISTLTVVYTRRTNL